jgi:hypothetical protein
MKKSNFIIMALQLCVTVLLIVNGCKKDETVKPIEQTPVIVEGFGRLQVNVSKMNIKEVYLVSGYDVYKLRTNTYVGSNGAYYCAFIEIKNKTYNYTVTYTDNSYISSGKVTIIKDETVIIQGL